MFFKNSFWCFVFLCGFNALHSMDIEIGTTEKFEEIKWLLDHGHAGLPKRTTKAADCRRWGYNGALITIVQHPQIIRAGYIIEGAQFSKWWGYSYDASYAPVNLILIEENPWALDTNVKY